MDHSAIITGQMQHPWRIVKEVREGPLAFYLCLPHELLRREVEVIIALGRLRKNFNDLHSFEKVMVKRYGKDIPKFPIEKESEITIETIDKLA